MWTTTGLTNTARECDANEVPEVCASQAFMSACEELEARIAEYCVYLLIAYLKLLSKAPWSPYQILKRLSQP